MKEEILEILEKLSHKFGTTTEELWKILIRQSRITAINNMIFIVSMLGTGFGFWGIHKILVFPHPFFDFECKDNFSTCYYQDYTWKVITPFGFAIVIWLPFAVAAFSRVGDIITGIYNPGYWAINDIGRRFGKG